MRKEIIPGVKRVKKTLAGGAEKVFYYHRMTGVRLPDELYSANFRRVKARLDREAEGASDAEVDASARDILWLVRQYKASNDWTKLAESTRKVEQFSLDAIEEEFGALQLTAVEERGSRAMFLEWRDGIAIDHPRSADTKLTRLARIFKFAADREIILRHPLIRWTRVYECDRSEVIWLPEHFRTLAGSASHEIMLAVFVALHTGQRRGDLLNLRWRNVEGDRVKLTQSKTGARVDFPCTRALAARLAALRAERQPEPGDHILLNPQGGPWHKEAWQTAWRRTLIPPAEPVAGFEGLFRLLPPVRIERDNGKVDVFDLHFHDIRGTAVTMLAEAGCTIPEICAITGHSLAHATRILERYLNATKAMADAAIAKLETKMIGCGI